MIRLEGLAIRNFRGILALDLSLGGSTFAIQGPNGSGKSGVVDAIEFALTGSINRLSGTGTKGVSLPEHGPHVDYRDKPREGRVTLTATIAATGKTATIERGVDKPHAPTILPSDEYTKAAFAHVARHPEFVLSRREIIKYILVAPGQRAEEIQSLLKLERIQQMRSALQTASNTFARRLNAARTAKDSSRGALRRALSIEALSKAALLDETNRHRQTLGLAPISELTPTTKLDTGLAEEPDKPGTPAVSRATVEADLAAIRKLYTKPLADTAANNVNELATKLAEFRNDPTLVEGLEKDRLFELALKLFDSEVCPVCDTRWSADEFRALVNAKQARLEKGKELKASLGTHGTALSERALALQRLASELSKSARALEEGAAAEHLGEFNGTLTDLSATLTTVHDMLRLDLEALQQLTSVPDELESSLTSIDKAVKAIPAESGQAAARSALITAQTRLEDVRRDDRKHAAEEALATRAKLALDTYDKTVTTKLNSLYDSVEKRFIDYYRLVNSDDESAFSAELKQETGGIDLKVDFYGRGHFPPAAYHSEGHQDGMGLCLYLALMNQVLGSGFTFAVLDDVVMSVDADHRRAVCRLLREQFPDTQFIITTHDKVWLGQMKTEKLVSRSTAKVFSRWSVDHGPFVDDAKEEWDRLSEFLDENNVPDAAGALRRYLESIFYELLIRYGGKVMLREDGRYEFGDLFPEVVSRWKALVGKAISAAQSWSDIEARDRAGALRDDFARACAAVNEEQWAVNANVHFNQWANFSKDEFLPVVNAFDTLLKLFRCSSCDRFLDLDPPRGIPKPKSLRCACGKTALNLGEKPKK